MLSRLLAVVLVATATLLSIAPTDVGAQPAQQLGVSVNPAIIEIVAEQGSRQTATVTVTNTTTDVLAMRFVSQSLIPIDTELDSARRSQFDASQWLQALNGDLILEPGEAQAVDLVIEVPLDGVTPGGHYAAGVFQLLGDTQAISTGAVIVPEVSVGLLINIPGAIDEQLEIPDEALMIKANGDTAEFSFDLRNVGNVHSLPQPSIVIEDGGVEVDRITLKTQLLLPNTFKPFHATWVSPTGLRKHSARIEVVYGSPPRQLVGPNTPFRVSFSMLQLSIIGFGVFTAAAVGYEISRKRARTFQPSVAKPKAKHTKKKPSVPVKKPITPKSKTKTTKKPKKPTKKSAPKKATTRSKSKPKKKKAAKPAKATPPKIKNP